MRARWCLVLAVEIYLKLVSTSYHYKGISCLPKGFDSQLKINLAVATKAVIA